jgi:hypothetical protein
MLYVVWRHLHGEIVALKISTSTLYTNTERYNLPCCEECRRTIRAAASAPNASIRPIKKSVRRDRGRQSFVDEDSCSVEAGNEVSQYAEKETNTIYHV